MKEFMYKLTSLFCTFSLLTLLVPASAAEFVSSSNQQTLKSRRMDIVFSQKIESMQPDDVKYRIDITDFTTRNLADFSGNSYTLVECEPSGYLIYHNDSGVFAESSLHSPSPYKAFSGPIFYNGPTNYYSLVSDELVHTISGEKLTLNSKLIQSSDNINNALLVQKDTSIVSFIEEGTSYTASTRASNTYVEEPYVIRALDKDPEMGYLPGNYCGYIAGGMATLYLQLRSGLLLVPSQYLSSSGISFNGNSFTSHLSTYGISNLTTASSLASALNAYFDANDHFVTANWSLFGSGNTIKNLIDSDKPVMVGGQYASDPNDSSSSRFLHFILAYGYGTDTSSSYFIVHYGWEDYSEVQINNGLFILQSADYVTLSITP